MNKNIKKFICLGLTLIACVVVLCACNDNKSEINAVDGEFYTLQEAYDNGWLSKTDLKNIAYQLNGTKPIGFTPKDKEPLSAEDERLLKNDYASRFDDGRTADDVLICGYYGQYNGFVAVIVDNGHFDVITNKEVGGVKFTYPDSNTITLWKRH